LNGIETEPFLVTDSSAETEHNRWRNELVGLLDDVRSAGR